MTAKKLIAAIGLLTGVTFGTATASFAQPVHYGGYEYGYRGYYGYNHPRSVPNWMRGGPGPRVLDGSGMGIGAVR